MTAESLGGPPHPGSPPPRRGRPRRHRAGASGLLLVLALLVTGLAYAAVVPGSADAAEADSQDVTAGQALFLGNCSTCHGKDASGRAGIAPSLVGVGAAAVDFQVGTGRMPMRATGPQAPRGQVVFTPEQTRRLAAYVASLAPGPAIPEGATVDPTRGDPSRGSAIFRTNCAMCHNFAGKGGALTQGKYAPDLSGSSPTHIYEAMITGPQSMPVFTDQALDPQSKRDVIAYLDTVRQAPNPGGWSLGSLGPVSEGLVAWVVGLPLLIGCAVWLGARTS